MPTQRPSTGILASLVRLANPLSIRQPLSIRTLSATRGRFTRGYGTVKSEIKDNEAKNVPKDSSGQSGGSKSKDAKDMGSSPSGGQANWNTASTGPKAPRKTPEEIKIEEEDIEYQAEVERHNKEFAGGYDRVPELSAENKVDEKFWKGAYQQHSFYHCGCF